MKIFITIYSHDPLYEKHMGEVLASLLEDSKSVIYYAYYLFSLPCLPIVMDI
jgi:hypothetical protein